MSMLRATGAILRADLLQRMRSPRYWIVMFALGAFMWWCLPPAEADYLTVVLGDTVRGRYSSAWVGMAVALIYSPLLSLAGFYLVRGTVTRDLDTRAWVRAMTPRVVARFRDEEEAREFLAFLATVKGLPARAVAARVDECLEMVGLHDVADRRLGDYSGGMRQRVGIAQALLNDPRLLIVDEPTVGLDPEERVRFRHLLAELAGQRLVILSTHIVSDIEASAGELAVMAAGQLRFHGTPEALIASAQGHVWNWMVPSEQLADVRAKFRISRAQRRAHGVEVRVVGERAPSNDAALVAPDLEDAYLWLLHRAGASA
jgi:ABC-type dipeptide/oligopeptide/nickel transport system ATPase subunit